MNRLLLATSQYAPETGGVPNLLWTFSRLCPADVTLRVLSVQQQPAPFYADFDAGLPFVVERVPPQRGLGVTSLAFAWRLRCLLADWRPDVLFCGVAYPTAVLGHLAHLGRNIPLVVYAHSEDVTISRPAQRQALALALRRATAVLTVSQFTQSHLRQLGVPANRIHLAPPGIETEPFTTARPHPGWPGKWVILTVARLVARKGQDAIIRALPQVLPHVPHAHYVIVGGGPDEPYLRQLAADLGIAEYVTFAGRVADADLPAYYARCDVFAMLTRPGGDEVEGFGITFLEAGAAGKPVIGGRAGGAVDAVQDGVTGLLLDPLDVAAIAASLIRLAQQPALAAQMGRAGRERVLGNYTDQAFMGRVMAVLDPTCVNMA